MVENRFITLGPGGSKQKRDLPSRPARQSDLSLALTVLEEMARNGVVDRFQYEVLLTGLTVAEKLTKENKRFRMWIDDAIYLSTLAPCTATYRKIAEHRREGREMLKNKNV